MELENAYKKLQCLDEEERIGYAYFQKTGSYLDYICLSYLKTQNNPYDFTILQNEESEIYSKRMMQQFEERLFGNLTEHMFIERGANTEIQHFPRYIDIVPHSHDFFEIVCTVKGRCLHRVENQETIMEAGDITIIPPKVRHYLRGGSDCVTFTIKTRRSTFDRVFSVLMRSGTSLSAYFAQTLYSSHYRNALTFHCGNDTFLPELLLHMYAQQTERKVHYNHVLDGLLSVFFPYLVQNYENTIEFSNGDNAQNKRMIEIENHIRQNYKSASLVSVADAFHMNPSYLSTVIKKQTGYTFSSILCRIRMEHAADLMKHSDLKVEQVCENIGYNDTTQFIKCFKKYYGATPLRFRNAYKSEQQKNRP